MPVTDGRKQHWSVKDPLQSREFTISLKKLLVRMEETPALFLASGQRASGVHERPYEAGLHKPCFFSIILKL